MVEQIQEAVNAYYSQFEEQPAEAAGASRRPRPRPPEPAQRQAAEAAAAAEAGGRAGRNRSAERAAEAAAGVEAEPANRPEARQRGTVWYDRRRGFPHSQSVGRSGPGRDWTGRGRPEGSGQ